LFGTGIIPNYSVWVTDDHGRSFTKLLVDKFFRMQVKAGRRGEMPRP